MPLLLYGENKCILSLKSEHGYRKEVKCIENRRTLRGLNKGWLERVVCVCKTDKWVRGDGRGSIDSLFLIAF